MVEHQGTSLEIHDPTGPISRLPLAGQRLFIGRAPEADIRLDRATVSRRHAELICDPFHRWWVRDLGSRNRTLVNGRAVAEQVLHPGDTVAVGEFVLKLVNPEAAAPAPPVQNDTSTNIPVTSGAAGEISRLKDVEPPRIASSHVSLVNEFGQNLLQVA